MHALEFVDFRKLSSSNTCPRADLFSINLGLLDKFELVKSIVTRLYLAIEKALNEGKDAMHWEQLETDEFFGMPQAKPSAKVRHISLAHTLAFSYIHRSTVVAGKW